jgi:DNA-binding transcriptional LysR family regulator
LRFEDDGLTRRVIHEERLSVAVPHGHALARKRKPIKLKHTVEVPLILYPNTPRPSYADQVLSFYRKLGLEPKVGFEVRELQTALGLVAADVGIALVPSSVRRLGRDDVEYLALNEPDITSPIMCWAASSRASPTGRISS